MSVAHVCAAVAKKLGSKSSDGHVLVATWTAPPLMVMHGCTLPPSDRLAKLLDRLPAAEGKVELYYHVSGNSRAP